MIGSKIRELRREKMWQQKDLANALQMGVGTISAWETGRAKPSKNAIKEMAKLFNVPIEYLTEDGAGKSKDGSAELAALLKVAENEINQLKDENQKLKNEIEWTNNENERLRKDLLARQDVMDESLRTQDENRKLKDFIVQMVTKGAIWNNG